jgi:hypothetical protein
MVGRLVVKNAGAHMNVGTHGTTVPDLDWQGFVAAYFPESRRHDLKAITAYAAYKRSQVVDEQSATEVAGLKDAERISTEATSVEAWEDEGGAAS